MFSIVALNSGESLFFLSDKIGGSSIEFFV